MENLDRKPVVVKPARVIVAKQKKHSCNRFLVVRKDPPFSMMEALNRVHRYQRLDLPQDLRVAWFDADPSSKEMTKIMVTTAKDSMPNDSEVFDNEELAIAWLCSDCKT